jgi:hypothetical protein
VLSAAAILPEHLVRNEPELPPELPAELRASVLRHQQHLARLVVSLRDAGVDEGVIEASVRQLVDSYGGELAVAMRVILLGQPND